jgi:ATP-dependent DNA ligase
MTSGESSLHTVASAWIWRPPDNGSVLSLPIVGPLAPTLAKPFHRPGWVYQEKYDGWRMIAYKEGLTVRLISRNNVDHTARCSRGFARQSRVAH